MTELQLRQADQARMQSDCDALLEGCFRLDERGLAGRMAETLKERHERLAAFCKAEVERETRRAVARAWAV